MGRKKLKVYTASNVGIGYFLFLGKTLQAAGYQTEDIFLINEDSYRRKAKVLGPKKIWLRIQMYMLYPFLLMYKAFTCKKESIFIITSNTFYAPILTHFILKVRGIKVIHLLYDLYPDALEIAGTIKYSAFWTNKMGALMRLSQRRCEATVYLGEYLRVHAENRWGKPRISKVIDISTDLSLYQENFESHLADEKLIIHYGGQLGYLHDAVSIIESVKFICQSDIAPLIDFNFYVSGAQATFLEDSLKGYPVKIISAIPSDQWRKDINAFHIGLVSLSPGGASVCLPSKTYGMMAGGLAILAICPEWSDLSLLVKSLDAGWVINNSIYQKKEDMFGDRYIFKIQEKRSALEIAARFYDTLKSILNDKKCLSDKRQNSYHGVRSKFNIESLSEKWDGLIKEVYEN